VSPDGRYIAFVDHPQRGNNDGFVKIIETSGKLRLAGPFVPGFSGLAWSPKSDEVWWGGIQATSLDGRTRTVWPSPNGWIQDVARDGSVLFGDGTARREIVGFATAGAEPRHLSELNWSFPVDISTDGTRVLFNEQQHQAVYVRGLDGSPGVRIFNGEAFGLSPDGRWAAAARVPERRAAVLVPTGAGEPKTLDLGGTTLQWANWFPDGKRLLVNGTEPGRGSRLYILDIEGGPLRPITPEGVTIANQAISPNGMSVAARGPDGSLFIYPTQPGEPVPVSVATLEDYVLGWTPDGRSLYVTRLSGLPGIIETLEIASGKRTPWTRFEPPDPSGIEVVGPAVIAKDGKSYVYSYRRVLDGLYLATGMR
jgi:dipeptidyl aminopeptidase/acylaminoacyl peptidase